ncbi:MAG: hypothetical protein KAT77_01250 [Nanoarchaeota archaeon]|nr:hypothetical protein [Nanoarchaeota archaeon]
MEQITNQELQEMADRFEEIKPGLGTLEARITSILSLRILIDVAGNQNQKKIIKECEYNAGWYWGGIIGGQLTLGNKVLDSIAGESIEALYDSEMREALFGAITKLSNVLNENIGQKFLVEHVRKRGMEQPQLLTKVYTCSILEETRFDDNLIISGDINSGFGETKNGAKLTEWKKTKEACLYLNPRVAWTLWNSTYENKKPKAKAIILFQDDAIQYFREKYGDVKPILQTDWMKK